MKEIISVIVPVYKVENYINKCVESIIAQTYTELDIILVDDGSTDRCGAICDEYAGKDSRVRVIHKDNGGLSSARNIALDNLKGSWVTCIDSDDYVHPDMIRRLYDAAIKNNADISICSHYEEKDGKLLITERVYDENRVWDTRTALQKLIQDEEVKNYAWGKLYKKELFDGVRYPNGRNYEDIATTYLLFDRAEKIVKIPDYLYYYYIRTDSISYSDSASTWHKGCHATCLGQEERADYLIKKKYANLYELAMSKLLPYLFSDISSGYSVNAKGDIDQAKAYLKKNIELFQNNPLITDKDKQLIPIYLKNDKVFKLYYSSKNAYKEGAGLLHRLSAKVLPNYSSIDFHMNVDKKKRIVYFELPCFDNLGDHAIAYVTESIIREKIKANSEFQLFVIYGWDTDKAINSLKKCISPDDIIICQGGGNFGSLYDFAEIFRRKVLKAFSKNKIIIMPQTLFYSEDKKGLKELKSDQSAIKECSNITIFARDVGSYELMRKYFSANIIQLHDIVSLYDAKKLCSDKRNGVIVCLRSDKESVLNSEDKNEIIKICEKHSDSVFITDTCTRYEIEEKDRKDVLENKIKLFGKSNLVVTDRLHGMIFSIITETPCIVLGNNHHKVFETYKTFRECKYIKYVHSKEELQTAMQVMTNYNEKIQKMDLSYDMNILHTTIFNGEKSE